MTTTDTENQDTNTELESTEELSQNDSTNTENHKTQEEKEQELVVNYQTKINDGKILHSEVPDWLQSKVSPKKDDNDLIEKAKESLKDDQRFEALEKQIPPEITDEDLVTLNKVLDSEIGKGRAKSEALEFAMYKVGLNAKANDLIKKGIKIERQSLIKRGDYKEEVKKKTELGESEEYFMGNLPKGFKAQQ